MTGVKKIKPNYKSLTIKEDMEEEFKKRDKEIGKEIRELITEINKEADFYQIGYYVALGLLGMFVLVFILNIF